MHEPITGIGVGVGIGCAYGPCPWLVRALPAIARGLAVVQSWCGEKGLVAVVADRVFSRVRA